MKFEIIYANAILNYLLNHIDTICKKDIRGNCYMHKFVIDILFISTFEDFSIRREKKEIRKLFKKIKETDYNLTAKHFIERFDNLFI